MSYEIRIQRLMDNLKKAEDETECFSNPLSDFDGYSSGVQYLYHEVLLPILKKQSVYVQNLDMNRFEQEDIASLYSFYEDKYSDRARELSRLHHIYETCNEATPRPVAVCFL